MNKVWLLLASALLTAPAFAQEAEETAPAETSEAAAAPEQSTEAAPADATTDAAPAEASSEAAPADTAAAPESAPAADASAEAAPAADASAEAAPAADASAEAAPSDTSAEAAPADSASSETATDSATSEEAPADTSSESAASESSDSGSSEAAATEEASGEESSSEESTEESEPLHLYVGADAARIWASVSDEALAARLGGEEFDGNLFRGRVGMRVFDVVGLEAHFGAGGDESEDAESAKVDRYWGVFAVPTGTFLDVVEISVPVGYSSVKLATQGGEETFSGVSFGLNIELPLRAFGDDLPNLRLTTGGQVYQAEKDARVYGAQAGVRFDFDI